MQISDVKINGRFQRAIRIDADATDLSVINGYHCPQSSKDVLLTLARSRAQTGQGAFTWTGPYGAGKSSLALLLSALLGNGKRLRNVAQEKLGENASKELLNSFDAKLHGWEVIAVVGQRGDPAAIVHEAALVKLKEASSRNGKLTPSDRAIDSLKRISRRPKTSGLLLIIDEMGKFLEEATSGAADVHFFQMLAEEASRSDGKILVIGILHQSFDDYAARLGREVRDTWTKIQGRFVDIPLNVAGEEQIDIIGRAIEKPKGEYPTKLISEKLAKSIRQVRPTASKSLGSQLTACWPLHPAVACLLGPISSRRFGQNQRSIFGFLNSAEPNGFQEFLMESKESNENVYDLARLWDYLRANLEPSILTSPDGHRWSLAVEAIARCETRDSDRLHVNLLKAISLIDLFKEKSGLLPSPDAIFACFSDVEKSKIETALSQLLSWSLIIFRRHANSYSLFAGSDFEIESAIETATKKLTGLDFDRLRKMATLSPIVAKRHFHEFGVLRWFNREILPLSEAVDFVRTYRPKGSEAGIFVLLIPVNGEDKSEITRIWNKACRQMGEWPVALGLSNDSFAIRNISLELLAIERVRVESRELEGDAVARREVNARLARLTSELSDQIAGSFNAANWNLSVGSVAARRKDIEIFRGQKGLDVSASALANSLYPDCPRIHNELLNRTKPSGAANGGRRILLRAMVERCGDPKLGIEGFPLERGLLESLLVASRLYRASLGNNSVYEFGPPPDNDHSGISKMWQAIDELISGSESSGITAQQIYAIWQQPPFGVREGVLPVFAVAYFQSRLRDLAIYLDGAIQPKLGSFFIDRLLQEPHCIRIRTANLSDFQKEILREIAISIPDANVLIEQEDSLSVARRFVGFVLDLKPWVLRTRRLSENALKVRDLAKKASDPNQLLFDDLPSLFGFGELGGAKSKSIVDAVASGLQELATAYPNLLQELAKIIFRELGALNYSASEIRTINERASGLRAWKGDVRLSAFALRLSNYSGRDEEIESIASLAANKPPRDWIDRDIDQAKEGLALLARDFMKAEGLIHVSGGTDHHHSVSIFLSEGIRSMSESEDEHRAISMYSSGPTQPKIGKAEVLISAGDRLSVAELIGSLKKVIAEKNVSKKVALGALAELGLALARESEIANEIVTKKRRIAQ